jgi:hypothetical protein
MLKMNYISKDKCIAIVNKHTQHVSLDFDRIRAVYNNSPSMIHENEFKPFDCILCGERVTSVHDSHNAFPLEKPTLQKVENDKGRPRRCCGKCDLEKVMPARINMILNNPNAWHRGVQKNKKVIRSFRV